MSAVVAIRPMPAPKKFEVSCASCNFRELCIPASVCADDLPRFEKIVYARRRVRRGEALFNAGDEFKSIYAVRSGFFKSNVVDGEGREQVTGFFMGGELLGMDGIGNGRHNSSAIALEDSEVCVLPYALIEDLARQLPTLARQLNAVLAREIVRDHGVMMLLGSMRAEERLATFLLNLSKRFTARGYSRSEFNLRMTREELGSYLGLKLETVSRLFSAFQKDGLIEVQHKYVRIHDVSGLEQVLHAN
jgi:CRP/FNR family transcriptional regulator, anaerobic regulatory protein